MLFVSVFVCLLTQNTLLPRKHNNKHENNQQTTCIAQLECCPFARCLFANAEYLATTKNTLNRTLNKDLNISFRKLLLPFPSRPCAMRAKVVLCKQPNDTVAHFPAFPRMSFVCDKTYQMNNYDI